MSNDLKILYSLLIKDGDRTVYFIKFPEVVKGNNPIVGENYPGRR
jgi:hypothetical protein